MKALFQFFHGSSDGERSRKEKILGEGLFFSTFFFWLQHTLVVFPPPLDLTSLLILEASNGSFAVPVLICLREPLFFPIILPLNGVDVDGWRHP